MALSIVMPAQAGIQHKTKIWMPACAGMTLAMLFCSAATALPGVGRNAVEPGENLAPSSMVPKELEGANIEEKPGAKLPLDVVMTNHDGKKVRIGDYFPAGNTKPVIMIANYYKCTALCGVVANGVSAAIEEISLTLGKDYSIISFSIDDRDTVDIAQAKRTNYLSALKKPYQEPAWHFLSSEAKESKRLADILGFGFKFDQKSGEYAHGAGIFIISPDGILSRTMFGISFKASELKFALIEASQGKIGSFADKIILNCFHYQADSHRYGVYVFGVMKLGGAITVLMIALMLCGFLIAERRRLKRA